MGGWETAIEGGIYPDEPQRLVYFWKVLTQRLIYFWNLPPDPPSRVRIVDGEPSEEFRSARNDACEFVFEARVKRHRDVLDPIGLRDISERRAHRSVTGR